MSVPPSQVPSARHGAVTAAGLGDGADRTGRAEPGLVLSRVTKRLGRRDVVVDMDLEVGPGELVCLLGPSGCGKTTTLRIIGGFLAPDTGEVIIGGQRHTATPPERRPTAMVFQSYALWPHMTVFKNVAFGLKLRKLPRSEIRTQVEEALELVGLTHHIDSMPGRISGGEQQRVALARALVLEPSLLLLDEPLSNLDAKLRARVREDIREIQKRVGITTVLVTHDQEEALAMADRIAVMNHGRIEQYAVPDELYREPATPFVAGFVGSINLLPARGVRRDGLAGFELAPDTVVPYAGTAPAPEAGGLVAVRPEDVMVSSYRAGPGTAPGRVVRDVPLGHYRELVIELGEIRLRAFVPPSTVLDGDTVGVAFSRVVSYPEGEGSAA